MIEPRLFRLAPQVVSLQATFVGGSGWSMRIRVRRQDEPWDEAYDARYDHLTTEELLQVVDCEVAQQLGLA